MGSWLGGLRWWLNVEWFVMLRSSPVMICYSKYEKNEDTLKREHVKEVG